MRRRDFDPGKKIVLSEFSKALLKDWNPCKEDIALIKVRLKEKIRLKPDFYRYQGRYRSMNFFLKLIDDA